MRLASARKMAGMSLQTLADTLENVITKQSLSKYEQGVMKPDSSLLVKLANVLDVPVDYFYDEPVELEFNDPDYRKHSSKVTQTEKTAIEEKSKHLLEKYFEIEHLLNLDEEKEYFEYKDVIKIPSDAEKAAKQLRKEWRLGYDPISDVVAMLEDKGPLT
ncbi:MAG: helix-turn-helix transcriptional regulator [Bacteroidota bacterium]